MRRRLYARDLQEMFMKKSIRDKSSFVLHMQSPSVYSYKQPLCVTSPFYHLSFISAKTRRQDFWIMIGPLLHSLGISSSHRVRIHISHIVSYSVVGVCSNLVENHTIRLFSSLNRRIHINISILR